MIVNLNVLNHPISYGIIKAIHIIFIVCWFAGLLYLPRLFVYHTMTTNLTSQTQFKTMQHRLFWYIMTPACIVTLLSGEILSHGFEITGIWLHIKIMLVISLVVYHIYCFKLMDTFAKDSNTKSTRWFRIFNEYPIVILILCVLLVTLKPQF